MIHVSVLAYMKCCIYYATGTYAFIFFAHVRYYL